MKHKGKRGQKSDKKTHQRYNAERRHMINGVRKLIKGMIPRPGKLKRQLESGEITQEAYDDKVTKATEAAESWKKTSGSRVRHDH